MDVCMRIISLSEEYLTVGDDSFRTNRIQKIWAKKLTLRCQCIRAIAIAAQMSLVGWVAQYWLHGHSGAILLPLGLGFLGLVLAATSYRRYELRALLTEVDETGEQIITLASGLTDREYEHFQEMESQWYSGQEPHHFEDLSFLYDNANI